MTTVISPKFFLIVCCCLFHTIVFGYPNSFAKDEAMLPTNTIVTLGTSDLPNGGDFNTFFDNDLGTCTDCVTRDSLALVAIYHSTNGIYWVNKWNLNEPIDTWYGVKTNSKGCVISINLSYNFTQQSGNNLSGFIPPEIENLKQLEILNLSSNLLRGSIPVELGNLPALRILDLRFNKYTGIIPKELGNLKNLTSLYLNKNGIGGYLPRELGNLSQLRELILENNQLKGSIPPELGKLSQLTRLNLGINRFSGSIPRELGNLSQLKSLYLGYNQLEGCIPESLLVFCGIVANYAFHKNPNLEGSFSDFCSSGGGFCTDFVWPGDFNNDGIVNHIDALYLGVAFGDTTGPIRPNASINWTPQKAQDWSTAVNQVNKKHQDANGDGVINQADFQILLDNFGKTHTTITTVNRVTKQVAYRLESIGYEPGGVHKYEIHIESGGLPTSLHGIAGTIDLGNMPIGDARLDVSNSPLNPDPSQIIQQFDDSTNTLEFALTRSDKKDRLCNGAIATLIIIMDDLSFKQPMALSVKLGNQMIATGDFNAIANTTIYDNYADVTLSSGALMVTAAAMHETCDMNGYAMVDIKGGLPPYSIQWSTGATSEKITDLSPGNYAVTVQDAASVQRTFTVEVQGNLLPMYDEQGALINCNTMPYDSSISVFSICNVPLITCGNTYAGSTLSSTYDNPNNMLPICISGGLGAPNEFYKLRGIGKQVRLSLCDANYDTRIDVYRLPANTCESGIVPDCINGNDDFCSFQSEVTFWADNGFDYFIMVHGWVYEEKLYAGNYTLTVDCLESLTTTTNSRIANTINGNLLTHETLQLAPNPTRSQVMLTYSTKEEQLATLRVYNQNGQLLMEEILPTSRGANNKELDTSHLKEGMYMITLQTEQKQWAKKLIIL